MKAEKFDEVLRREIQGYESQNALAVKAGISQPSLSMYLSGKQTLKWPIVCKLLSVLGLKLVKVKEKVEA